MQSVLLLLRLSAVTFCLGGLAACTTLDGSALVQSQVSAELSTEAANAIADDMVTQLAEHLGPGITTIALAGKDAIFGPALEAALRNKGYAVVTEKKVSEVSAVPLAYVIDPFEGGVLVRVSTPKIELTRIYTQGATGATSASPMSVMQRGATTRS